MSHSFSAQWGGICGSCTERFAPGDPVRFIEDEVCHDACDERRVTGRTETICGHCFMTACDCGRDE